MPLIPDVVKKDMVVMRLAGQEGKALRETIERINKLLSECVELPLTVTEKELGPTRKVRDDIIRRLKEAGWVVMKRVMENNPGNPDYEIQ